MLVKYTIGTEPLSLVCPSAIYIVDVSFFLPGYSVRFPAYASCSHGYGIRSVSMLVFFLFASVALATPAFSEIGQWGDLSGQFVYDGEPPKLKPIMVKKDKAALGSTIPDESLVVNSANRGLENVVVYLLPKPDEQLRVHPSYDATADAKIELTMHKGQFKPHVLLMRDDANDAAVE